MSVLFNEDEHAPGDLYSSSSEEFFSIYTKKGSNDLFEEDDGDYYLNERDANLSILDLRSDDIISTTAYPFGYGILDGISHDGNILLGYCVDSDKLGNVLVDAKSGSKVKFGSSDNCLSFMNGDREILANYQSDYMLHVNIYKSNIPHSLPEDVLYFVQTSLPFVIGGGVAIVLIIGGAIVILCIRKKRTRTANGMAAAAPKPQRKQAPSPEARPAERRSAHSTGHASSSGRACPLLPSLRNPARTRSPVLSHMRTKGRLANKTQ